MTLVRVVFRDHSDRLIERFVEICRSLHFDFGLNDINADVMKFDKLINDLYCECFPRRIKFISSKRLGKPWLSSAIFKSIKTKCQYYKLFKLGLMSSNCFKQFRNRLTGVIREAKKRHYTAMFNDCRNNIKSTWKLINELVGTKGDKDCISSIIRDNDDVHSACGVASKFNEYFANVSTNIDATIPPATSDPVASINVNCMNSIYLSPISPSEIRSLIKGLKNSTYGLDRLPTKMFKHVGDALSLPISKLINASIATGVFPDLLKAATVVPVHKAGIMSLFTNYRPISVLPLLSKIFEKCICVRLVNFFGRENIINVNQFGFQRGKCTYDAIANFTEYLYENLNLKKHIVGVFIDLRKAFDTVKHDILLRKLYVYGIRGLAHRWFESYLSNRTQCVRIGSFKSKSLSVTSGIPQGSVIGPLLFLIYINDLPRISENAHFTLFADDTTIAFAHSNYSDAVSTMCSYLERLNEWTINNRLSLNADKTSAMLFTNRMNSVETPIILRVANVTIDLFASVKFLGVIIDHKLNFSSHINSICTKLSKTAGVLYRISADVPDSVLINLYYSLVYPYLLYGILIWGGTAQVHLRPLELIHKRIVRIITRSDYLAASLPLFHRTKILKLSDLYLFQLGIHMYKLNFASQVNYPNYSYETRFRNNAISSFQRLTSTQRSLTHCGPRYWNLIPRPIRDSSTLPLFKKKLKQLLLDSYQTA